MWLLVEGVLLQLNSYSYSPGGGEVNAGKLWWWWNMSFLPRLMIMLSWRNNLVLGMPFRSM